MAGILEQIAAMFSTEGSGDKPEGPYAGTKDLHIGDPDKYAQDPTSSDVDLMPDAKHKDKEGWTDEDRGVIMDRGEGYYNGVRDRSNTDQVRDMSDPYWRNNHAMNNRRGNLNGKTYRSTLNLSRAADRLNNKMHWMATGSGTFTNGSIGNIAGQLPEGRRFEDIKTQEMRQMRANENVDMAARSRDVNRQANILDYPQELQRQADQNKFSLASLLNTSDVNISNAMRNSAVNINMNMPAANIFAQRMQNFANELALRTGDRKMQIVADAYNKHGDALGMLYAKYLLGQNGFTRRDAANSQYMKVLFDTYGNNPEMYNALVAATGWMSSMVLADTALGGM